MNEQHTSGSVLTEAVERTVEVIERQLELVKERAPGNMLDKRPVVQSLRAHAQRLRKALAAAPALGVSEAQRQQVIAEFLESTGQYVTNDASREADRKDAYAEGWQDGSSETVRLLSEPAKKLIGWRTPDYLYETSDRAKAKSWEPSVGALPIFEGDPNTKLAAIARALPQVGEKQ